MRIEDLDIEQLLELNALICRRIDELRAHQDLASLRRLRLGQQVHFDSAEGKVFGTLIKINRKSVLVVDEAQRRWKLPPGLLTVVEKVN